MDMQSIWDSLSDDAEYMAYRAANDDLSEGVNEVFFYGHLLGGDMYIIDDTIDETKLYSTCPHCGHLIELAQEPENGQDIHCSSCGNEGFVYDLHDRDIALECVCQRKYAVLEIVDRGYVLRLFECVLDYSNRDYDDYEHVAAMPELAINEVGRECWIDGQVSYYDWNLEEIQTELTEDDGEYWLLNMGDTVYESFATGWIMDFLENSDSNALVGYEARHLSPRTFATLRRYGFIELLHEYFFQDVFPDSAKISEILGVDFNKLMSVYQPDEVHTDILKAARVLEKYNIPLSVKNVDIMLVFLERGERLDITAYLTGKTFKYIRNQAYRAGCRAGNGMSTTARDYLDYLGECKKLDYDLCNSAVRYPTDLQKAHAETSKRIAVEGDKITEKALRDIYNKYRHLLEWSDGVYAIVMPKSQGDIISEGAKLSHCVGGYCERMANGEDFILFLRKADCPNDSFYTVEIRPNVEKFSLVQCRGFKNQDESKELREKVDDFLERYAAWFNRRDVTDPPASMIRTYYKAVHKTDDGRYISGWDGKTEYVIGDVVSSALCEDPDLTAVPGIHLASLEFAKNYGKYWNDVAILEIQVDMNDVVIPPVKDQIRAKCGKVIREVPITELNGMAEEKVA